MCTSSDDRAVIKSIISIAHHFDCKVIAEGVETLAQYNLLKQLNCDEAQGYFLAKPMDIEGFMQLMRNSPFIHP